MYLRKHKYWQTMKKYLFRIQPSPAYETMKYPEMCLRQRIFIESPDVGVYQKKFYYSKKHKHTQVSSILYITKGKAEAIVGNKKTIVKPGQFLYVPANVEHLIKVKKPDKYIEYIEVASPSFAFTMTKDTVWSKINAK